MQIDFEAALTRSRRIYPVDLLWRTGERFGRDDGAIYAAAVAFHLLLSLFPLLIVFVAVFGLLTSLPGFGPWLVGVAANQVPGDELKRLIESISGVPVVSNGVAGLAGLVALIVTASGMFGALRKSLNRAFGITAAPAFVRARALDLAGVGCLFLIGLLPIGLSAALNALHSLVESVGFWPLTLAWSVLNLLIPYATSVLVALLLYRLVPNHGLPVRDLWPAALLAGLGFQLTVLGFTFYLSHFGSYEAVYGALAGAVALLIFLNLDATIILYAGVFTAELARDRQRRSAT